VPMLGHTKKSSHLFSDVNFTFVHIVSPLGRSPELVSQLIVPSREVV